MRSGMVGFLGAQPPISGDPAWANVVSRLAFDGADGSTTIVDEKGLTWNAWTGAQLDADQSKWGGSSLLLGGGGAHASTADSSGFNFTGTDDGALECWLRPTSISGLKTIASKRQVSGASTGFSIGLDNGVLFAIAWGAGAAVATYPVGTTVLPINDWSFVQVLMGGGEWAVAVNGVIEAVDAVSIPIVNNTNALYLGRDRTNTSRDFVGHVDDFRSTFGASRPAFLPTGPLPTSA